VDEDKTSPIAGEEAKKVPAEPYELKTEEDKKEEVKQDVKKMTDKIVNHTHCQMCAKAIPAEDRFCSDACKDNHQMMVKKRKKSTYMFLGIMVVLFLFMLFGTKILSFLGGGQ